MIQLLPGDYTLTEITAPDGYNIAESISFVVNEDGLVAGDKVTMKDEPYAEVVFSKQDLSGKEIGGAEIHILDSKGSILLQKQ